MPASVTRSRSASRSLRSSNPQCGPRSERPATAKVGVIGTAGTIQSRAYDDAFAAASRRTVHAGLPAVRRVRRSRSHQQPRVVRGRRAVPRAAESGGHRHPRARLHPLPAHVGGHPVRDGTRRAARVECRRDGGGCLRHPRFTRHPAHRSRAAPPPVRVHGRRQVRLSRRLAHRFLGPEVSHVETFETGRSDTRGVSLSL